jgi:methionyl-tRNA synthetase
LAHFENYNFNEAIEDIKAIVHLGNANLSSKQFWSLKGAELESVIYFAFEVTRIAGLLLEIFVP